MILVLLGTQNNSFNRLLEEVDNLIKKDIIKEDVVVQAGYTNYKSDNIKIFDMVSNDELYRYQTEANLIISHGGVGSIISSIKKGKKVIAVPRLSEFGEHVNDHQKDIVKKFDREGFIIGIQDVSELEDAIIKSEKFEPKKYQSNNAKMINLIENFIDKNVK